MLCSQTGMAGQALLRGSLRTLRPASLASTSRRFPSRTETVLQPAPGALYPAWSASPVRTLQLSSALCAGHNKWSKVKHIKGPKDEARGRMFMKYGMMIRIAVKEGGSNPEMNTNLANLLEQCRSKNMPKASIDAAIKSAEKAKPASQHIFEARGPGGCLLLVEVLTDNITRSHQEIKRIITRNGGMLSDGARNNFSKRGVVVAAVSGQDVSSERALELAIEAGAEDVLETEDEDEKPVLQFICDMTDVRKVRASLEGLGMQIASSGLEFVPRARSSLDEDQLDAASSLIEALSEHLEVVRVWDNIQGDS